MLTVMRKLALLVSLALLLALAACTTTSSPSPSTSTAVATVGVVTGAADTCTGVASPRNIRDVTVQIFDGRTLISSETLRSGADYRFSVAAGRYRLTNGYGLVDSVVVRPGRTTSADLVPDIACTY